MDHASGEKKKQMTKGSKTTNQTAPPATVEKNKIKQPHIRLALSRADTLAAIKSAPGQRHLHARLVRQGR